MAPLMTSHWLIIMMWQGWVFVGKNRLFLAGHWQKPSCCHFLPAKTVQNWRKPTHACLQQTDYTLCKTLAQHELVMIISAIYNAFFVLFE